MKRTGLLIGLLLFLCHSAFTVKAEGLNPYEIEVIEEAQQYFEVDGITYQVKDSYIQALKSYLLTEIDLTKEQKDKVLSVMHSNVEQGIKEGYLEIVENKQEDSKEEESNIGKEADTPGTADPIEEADTPETVHPVEEADVPEAAHPTKGVDTIDTARPIEEPTSTEQTQEATPSNSIPLFIDDALTKDTTNQERSDNTEAKMDIEEDNVTTSDTSDDIIFALNPFFIMWPIVTISLIIVLIFIYKRRGRQHNGGIYTADLYDMHSHILPGIDDGSRSMEETKEMLRLAYEEGIRTIITTPHYESGRGQNTERILKLIEQVNIEAKKIAPDFTIYSGNELYYSDSIVADLKAKKAFTLAETDYVLVEFSVKESYETMFKGLNSLVTAGYIPVLAHVERYQCLRKNEERIYRFIDLGAYIQMNCSSLEGGLFNRESKYNRSLIKKRLVHFLSTDCHGANYRSPLLGSIVNHLSNTIEGKELDEILIKNPQTLLENKYI